MSKMALTSLLALSSIAACAGAAPRHEPGHDLRALAWLAGDWIGQGPDGSPAEELWSAPEGGAMRGRAIGEALRIEAGPAGIDYVARPDGASAETRFRAVEIGEGRAVFENAEHDFPQRIEYETQPDGGLRATISDLAGARRRTWTFRPRAASAPSAPAGTLDSAPADR